jgi:hypothetical protein
MKFMYGEIFQFERERYNLFMIYGCEKNIQSIFNLIC